MPVCFINLWKLHFFSLHIQSVGVIQFHLFFKIFSHAEKKYINIFFVLFFLNQSFVGEFSSPSLCRKVNRKNLDHMSNKIKLLQIWKNLIQIKKFVKMWVCTQNKDNGFNWRNYINWFNYLNLICLTHLHNVIEWFWAALKGEICMKCVKYDTLKSGNVQMKILLKPFLPSVAFNFIWVV